MRVARICFTYFSLLREKASDASVFDRVRKIKHI